MYDFTLNVRQKPMDFNRWQLRLLIDQTAQQTRALLREVTLLRGILPICSFCKKIRTEDSTWERIETYITNRSEAQFSHSVCPDCLQIHYPDFVSPQVPGKPEGGRRR